MKKAIIAGVIVLSVIGIAAFAMTQDVDEEIIIENIETDNEPKHYTVGLSESLGVSQGSP